MSMIAALAASPPVDPEDPDLNRVGWFLRRMFVAFDNIRLSRLSILMSLLATLLFLVGVIATSVTLTSVSTISGVWRDFDTGLGRRFGLFAEMHGHLGYSGLARHWLQWQAGDDEAPRWIRQDLEALRRIFPAWSGARPGADETQALQEVALAVEGFETALAANRRTHPLAHASLEAALERIEALLREERLHGANAVEEALWHLVVTVGTVMICSGAALVTLALFFVWFTRFRVLAPIRASSGAMRALADGNTAVEIPFTDKTDELGEMARTVLVFRDNALERNRLQEEQRALEQRSREERRAEMMAMADNLQECVRDLISTLRTSVSGLYDAADALSHTAGQTRNQSAAVSSATEQATASVQVVASAGAQLSASIQEISRQMTSAADVAQEAMQEAEQANQRIASLLDAATRIGEVVDLINDVASQTNLLALNATIESARAGEAGKGFAIVAQEVKALAGQTARATQDIAGQVAAIQTETREVAGVMAAIGTTIHRINGLATSISGAVEEQGAATAEIARSVAEASDGTQAVAVTIADVAQAAAQTGERAQGVFGAADALIREIGSLEGAVDHFLANLRAR